MLDKDALGNIPEELAAQPKWAYAIRDNEINISYKKAAKAIDGEKIDQMNWSTGPYKTLTDLLLHYDCLSEQDKNKIGYATYMTSDDDDYACIDLDPKENPQHLELAKELVKKCDNTYVEKSQSGSGYHIWMKDIKRKETAIGINGFIDIFSGNTKGRHLVTTGDRVSSTKELSSDPSLIDTLLQEKQKDKPPKKKEKSGAEKLLRNRGNFTIQDIAEVLDFIDNETSDDYDRWLRVIFGVAHELFQHPDGYELLYNWSARGAGAKDNWQEKLKDTYYSADNQKDDPITFRSVLYEARQSYGKDKMQLQREIDAIKSDSRFTAAQRKEQTAELIKAKRVLFDIDDARKKLPYHSSPSVELVKSFPKVSKYDLPHLTTTPTGAAAGRQEATFQNIEYLMQLAKMNVRYNILTREVEWEIENAPKKLIKDLGNETIGILSGYAREVNINSQTAVRSVISNISLGKKYHPYEELLAAAPAWDGVDRIAELAETVPVEENYKEIWPVYLEKTLYKIMDRILSWRNPNQHRGMLVLSGPQGKGKSSWCEMLVDIPGGENTFSQMENARDMNHKDSLSQVGCYLLVEFAEADSMIGKQGNADFKQFTTKKTDEYRPPYGTSNQKFPRVFTIIGTTNADQLFHDQSGTTRFWFVKCQDKEFDLEKLEEINILQLWKQVEIQFKEKQSAMEKNDRPIWHLTKEEDRMRESLNSPAVAKTGWAELFENEFFNLNWNIETLENYSGEKYPYKLQKLANVMLNNGYQADIKKADKDDIQKVITKITGVEMKKYTDPTTGKRISESFLLPKYDTSEAAWPDLNESSPNNMLALHRQRKQEKKIPKGMPIFEEKKKSIPKAEKEQPEKFKSLKHINYGEITKPGQPEILTQIQKQQGVIKTDDEFTQADLEKLINKNKEK